MKKLGGRSPDPADRLDIFHATSLDRLKTHFNGDQRFQPAAATVTGVDHVVVEFHVSPSQAPRLSAHRRPLDKPRFERLPLAMKIPPGSGQPFGPTRYLDRTDREIHRKNGHSGHGSHSKTEDQGAHGQVPRRRLLRKESLQSSRM